uniref:RNA-directed DNA polymerase n=1 Tax=Dictyostelium discoideum TaxID=44689 RepID=Q9GQ51_DICDI|nr:polyprotein [Dictyostelium discoideum]
MSNNENIIFSGDGKGLSFRKFKHLLLLIHGEEISKADIIRKLRNNALEYAATLDTDLTAMEIIEDLKDAFDIGDSDDLTELTKLGEYKYNTLDILIGKFLSKCSAVDISEKFKIQLFYSAVGTELGIEITKCAPKSLKRAIDIAKSCEDGSIRIKGRSMYTGQLVAKTLQEFGNQRYLGSGSGYSATSPQYVTSQNEQQSIESEEISTPIFKNQYYNRSPQMSPQSSPYKAPQNQVNSITKFCKYCKKKGHVIQECWSKDKKNNYNENKQSYNNHSTNAITMVNDKTINSIGTDSMNAALLINDKNVRGLVDTGSSLTIIWESIAKKLNLKVEGKSFSVNSASNNEIKIVGSCDTIIKLGKASAKVNVNIVKDNDTSIDCIFGVDTLIGLKLIIDCKEMIIKNLEFNVGTRLITRETKPIVCKIDLNILEKVSKPMAELLIKNEEIFETKLSKPGSLIDVEHSIKLTDENVSVYTPPYKTSPADKEFIEEYIKDALDKGIIEKSDSSQYGSPIVLSRKNDKIRFCVNYKKLNDLTIKDRYPLPLISDCWYYLKDAKVFSKIDLTSGYYQIKMKEEDKDKTTFVSHMGQFRYVVMPFGLCNAPATFQRYMNELLKDELRKSNIGFIDDCIIYSKNNEYHIEHVKLLFEKFKEKGAKLQITKCEFEKEEIKFLGYIVSKNGITYDSSKFNELLKTPPPSNQKELMKLLGTVNYFRTFIKNFTHLTSSFYPLLKKGVNFKWTDELENDRVKLFTTLAQTNLLSFPQDTDDNVIETDASIIGIGGVMIQNGKPVSYYSRTLNNAEKNYSVTERECLAIIESIKYFKSYINGRKVKIITDHQPLKYLLTGKFTDRITRWTVLLQEYNYEIIYRPGKENFLADALSRCPDRDQQPIDCDIPEKIFTITHYPVASPSTTILPRVLPSRSNQTSNVSPATTIQPPNSSSSNQSSNIPPTTNQSSNITNQPINTSSMNLNQSLSNQATTARLLNSVPISINNDNINTTTPQFTQESIRKELEKENYYRAMYKYLEETRLPDNAQAARRILFESEFYSMINGFLCHGLKHTLSSKKSHFKHLQIVVPKTMTKWIMEIFHDSPLTGGHFGLLKTVAKIKERFYWIGMIKDIKEFIDKCTTCLQIKRKYGPKEGLLIPIEIEPEPFNTIGIDFIGPITKDNAQVYLLVVMDYFTKWPEVFFTLDMEGETVAQLLLYEIYTRYGVPKKLVSDRGKNFLSNVVSGVNKLFGVHKLTTTAYHPQCDGQTENFNNTLIKMLKAFIGNELYGNWGELLRCVLYSYRITPHVSTGFSPFFLLFNRQPTLPLDTTLNVNFYSNSLRLDFADNYAQSVNNNLKRAFWFTKNNLDKAQELQKTNYDKGRRPTNIQTGDFVYLHTPYSQTSIGPKKFYKPWRGPFKVQEKVSDVTFKLDMGNLRDHKVVNIERLKKIFN